MNNNYELKSINNAIEGEEEHFARTNRELAKRKDRENKRHKATIQNLSARKKSILNKQQMRSNECCNLVRQSSYAKLVAEIKNLL